MSGEARDGELGELQVLLAEIAQCIEPSATVLVEERGGELWGRFEGDDVGPLIGRRGQTIDAIEHLAQRIVSGSARASRGSRPGLRSSRSGSEGEHGEEGGWRRIVVDAGGYRERRAAVLCAQADEAAAEALRSGVTVELEPMSSRERRVVHEHLRERGDVLTRSEGQEPERRLLVSPAAGERDPDAGGSSGDADVSRFSSR